MPAYRFPVALRTVLAVVASLAVVSCAHPISKELRSQAGAEVPFSAISANPEAYRGRLVILSGYVVQTENLQDGTMMEILQAPGDAEGRPQNPARSQGRFFAFYPGRTLDPAVWHQGRSVVVAGEVTGGREGVLGEVRRIYPLIQVREIHPFERRRPVSNGPWYFDDDDREYPFRPGFSIGIWNRF